MGEDPGSSGRAHAITGAFLEGGRRSASEKAM